VKISARVQNTLRAWTPVILDGIEAICAQT